METPSDSPAAPEGLVDPVVVIDREGSIVDANPEFARVSGREEGPIVGMRLADAWPAIREMLDHARYLHAVASGESVRFEHAFSASSLRYEIAAQPLDGSGIRLAFRDTRDPASGPVDPADEPIRDGGHPHASLHSRMLAHMGTCLRADLGAEETFYQMACILGQLPGVTRATFGTVDNESRTTKIHRDFHKDLPSMAGTYRMSDAETTSQELGRGQVVVITDVRTDYRSRDKVESRYKLGYLACVAIPLMRDQVWTATLMVSSSVPRVWLPEEVELIRTAAERTWLAVENARLLQEARQANAAKDRFLAMLSHELRTPLTPVVMMLSALQLSDRIDEEAKEDLAMIRRNIDLETRLIDDLLDITRIANGKLQLVTQPARLHELLDHVRQICAEDARKAGIDLACRFSASRDDVEGDSARLEQVFWNLVKNAIKFTPAGGRVRVITEDGDGELLVSVRDTGAGMAPEVLPRIFDAFDQGGDGVTRIFGGLGLGLAISKAIVDLHGGRIWARSDGPKRGSSLHVALPVAAPSAGVAGEPQPAAPRVDGVGEPRSLRVLLVDDNADTLKALRRLLTSRGMRVTTAMGVEEALLAASEATFDLLISDIGLPDGTGCDLMQRLRTSRPPSAIALSGYGMEADVQRSLTAGFDAHLVKPVNPDQLERVIAQLT